VRSESAAPRPWGAVARPRIVARTSHHSRPDGIEFDIAAAIQEIGIAVDRRRAVAALPQGARAALDAVDVAHIAPAERLQGARNALFLLGSGQQMNVVGHQHISMDRQSVLARRVVEPAPILCVVLRRKENRLPIVAALDEVAAAGSLENTACAAPWPAPQLAIASIARDAARYNSDPKPFDPKPFRSRSVATILAAIRTAFSASASTGFIA